MIPGHGRGLRGLENAVGRGGVERTRAPCLLWAVRKISVPDLGQQGALLHMGPACLSDKNVHPSVCRHLFLGVCA